MDALRRSVAAESGRKPAAKANPPAKKVAAKSPAKKRVKKAS
jgi:hypothetical protein